MNDKTKPQTDTSNLPRQRLEVKNPVLVDTLAHVVGTTGSIRAAELICGISERTIRRIRDRNPEAFEEGKQEAAADLLLLGSAATKKAAELLPNEKSAVSAMTCGGIAFSRMLDLSGQGTPAVQISILAQAIQDLNVSGPLPDEP